MKKKFRSLEIQAKRYLDTFSSGIHGTLLKDSLIEVDVVRPYQPGDKRLDSKSSLKTGQTMSRVFNPERSLSLYIILDLSSSQYTKLDHSIITALFLCYLGDMCNERIGLCIFSDKINIFSELSEDYSGAVGNIEKALVNLEMDKTTAVEEAISRVSGLSLTNSIIVFISDFCYSVSDNFYKAMKKMAMVPTNSFVNVVMQNPKDWLQGVSDPIQLTFRDAETGKIICYDPKCTKNDRVGWINELTNKLTKCHTDVVLLDVQQERYLLPLIKYLMRS